jgi:uncharacterized membrane protein YkvA (DUF1232 family)
MSATMAPDAGTVRNRFWPKLRRFVSVVPFAEEAAAAYYCAFDPVTPVKVKGLLLAALAYFVMPTDLLPDFIVGLGFTDDATVIATAIGLISAHLRPEHREQARKAIARMRRGEPAAA